MALPVTITGISTAVAPVGPFKSSGGNYYFFGRDGTTATTLQAFKSTAPDTSWASIANKTGFTTAILRIAGYQVGNVIHLAVQDGTANTLVATKYLSFDASTDTFLATTETVAAAANITGTAGSGWGCSLVVRSNGNVVTFYNGTQVTQSRLYYRERTALNTYGTATLVDAGGVNGTNPIVVLGASDRLHFLWFNATNTIQRHLTSANVLGTAASTGATALPQDIATDTINSRFVGYTATSAFRWISADNPTVTNAAITFGTPVRAADVNGVFYALYQNSTDSDLYVKKSIDSGATWDAGTNVFTGTVASADANLSKNQSLYVRGASRVFPYIVNDNGTLKYNEAVIATPVSDAWNADDKTGNTTLSNSDKTATITTTNGRVRSTQTQSSGKFYAEFLLNDYISGLNVGLVDTVLNITSSTNADRAFRVFLTSGAIFANNTNVGSIGSGGADSDVICLAWDSSAKRGWFRKNGGLWNNDASANPATGVNGVDLSYIPAGPVALYMQNGSANEIVTVRTKVANLTVGGYPSGFTSWMGEAITTANAYTMPAATGAVVVAGIAAIPAVGMPVTAGAVTVTGNNATLTKGVAAVNYPMAAATGSVTVSGSATGLAATRFVRATVAPFNLTGIAATLTKASAGGSTTPPAFRSISSIAYGSRTNTVVTAPAGIVDGDILILSLFMGAAGAAPPTPTLPTGFTLIDSTAMVDGSSFNGAFRAAWKRASSESGSYTVTHTAASTQADIAVYSGCIASGSPIDAYSKNSSTSGSASGTSITTSVANTELLYLGNNWDATGALTPPTGMTERFDSLLYLADQALPSAGATSTRTQTLASSNPWTAFLVALLPAAGGASTYTLTAAVGSVVLAGTATSLRIGRSLAAAKGSVALAGTATGLKFGHVLTAAIGPIILAGTATGLRVAKFVRATVGPIVLAGTATNLVYAAARKLAADTGAIVVSGISTALNYGSARTLLASTGSVVVNGTATGLRAARMLAAVKGSVVLAGLATALRAARGFVAATGAVTVAGISTAILRYAHKLVAAVGPIILNGTATGLLATRILGAVKGSIVLAGSAANLVYSTTRTLIASTGSIVLAGTTTGLKYGRVLTAAKGSIALAGLATGLRATRILTAVKGSIVLTGFGAGLIQSTVKTLRAATGSITLAGQDAVLRYARKLVVAKGTITLAGSDTLLLKGKSPLLATTGAILVAGNTANLVYRASYRMAAASASIRLAAREAGLSRSGTEQPGTMEFGRKAYLRRW